ncbi:hypothetical protein HNY73_000522 [Argiope bruennichi]|uniref:Uncharacterized protein n=1 Tax=Argiope bruennichi TaxID=94029 RepID=A0A8T0FZB6_ARGBR|nr:hypothetical protein HNY73_000522 [Argiope bruennichi]
MPRNIRRSQQDHMTTGVKKKYPKQTLTLDLWSPEEMRQEKKGNKSIKVNNVIVGHGSISPLANKPRVRFETLLCVH